jgi:hypothetical protein
MRRRPPARLAGVAALAYLAALIPAAALAAGGSPTSAASTPACTTSGLVVWLNTEGNGTAGSIYYTLEFTNLSSQTCTLGGYPGVSAVNLAGHQLGSPASRENTGTPHVITLASGASATAVLRIVEAGNFPSSTCHLVTAAWLRVFPPNLTASKVVPFPFDACSHTGPVYLQVRAVKHA